MTAAELTAALVAIDSVNPDLVADGAGEREIAAYIEQWARDSALEADVHEATAGRPSVVVRARGTGGGRTLLLCGHTDTVTTEGMREPLVARREGDRLHGRGAYDMKGGLAAALVACRDAAAARLAGDVVVAAVADEEHASLGVQEVLQHVTADAAIVTEPTELAIVIAHRGFVWAEIEVRGVAAHGSRPHLADDAIAKAGPVLTRIAELDARLHAPVHPLLGRASVHASTIAGGEELSSYPARCVVGLERRTLPGESAETFEAELDELVRGSGAKHRILLERRPYELDADAEIVRALSAAAPAAPVEGASYWADSAFIGAAGIPTVLFGPRGEGAHAAEEWVSVESLEETARVLTSVARSFCNDV
ncbi:MAG TPA: M20/M25/M40 family metallo-hydrolase [Gaiellaceae bacterium]